jgi:spore maturation protein SpmA
MIVAATVVAAYRGKMGELTNASLESAETAVTLSIGLIGAMALWLGILKVAEVAGLMRFVARLMRPLMVWLFPEVPAHHPAMAAMLLNMAANALGLGNAATPMGLKAMTELDKLNPNPGTATNAMCLFLAINTSSLILLPIDVIAVRSSAGSSNPAAILVPTLFATTCSTTVAIIAAKLMAKRSSRPTPPDQPTPAVEPLESVLESTPIQNEMAFDPSPDEALDSAEPAELIPPGTFGNLLFGGLIVAFLGAVIYRLTAKGLPYLATTQFASNSSNWFLPILICAFLLFSYFKGVKVYEVMTEGAKEGFDIAVKIIPFLVAILVAIGMFRASGALDLMATGLSPITAVIGLPPEALPMVLIRPLSGSGAFGLMSDLIKQAPDSFLASLVSVMQGSTETTFYVLAVYFGSIGISRPRHAVPAALCADAAGMLASLAICHLLF